MKKLNLAWLGFALLMGCSSESEESKNVILDVRAVIEKKKDDVEKVVGVSEKDELLKNKYPCENEECEKSIYQKGKFEIIYKDDKINRITINKVTDLAVDDSAIESLGFEYSKSQFSNEGVRKWTSINGIDEIAFFPEYILIIVKK